MSDQRIGFFARGLTLWVLLCMALGIAVSVFLPGIPLPGFPYRESPTGIPLPGFP